MSRRIVQVVAGLCNQYTAISINSRSAERAKGVFGPLLCNDRPMETDSYWRTRCIGKAMDQGYTFLRLTCSCGRITDYPFTLLLQRQGVSRDTFTGNIRFRCKKCGGKKLTIGVHSQTNAPGYFQR